MASTNIVGHHYLGEVHVHTLATLLGEYLNIFVEACWRAISGREEECHIRTGRTVFLIVPLIGFVPILQFLVRFFIVCPEVPADSLCQQPYLAFVARKLGTEMGYKAAWLHPYPRRIHKFTTIDVSPK